MNKKPESVVPISKPLFEFPVGNCLYGVYFLMQDTKCMYIGYSTNVYKRIGDHQADQEKAGKFNNIRFLKTKNEHPDIVESYLIGYFKPPLNYTSGYKVGHLSSLDELMSQIDKYIN